MVDVPTMTDFAALAARVTALEADAVVPPEPTPPVDGVQAKRIVDLIEMFGVNTFSSMDEHNTWGSWPANYSPDSTIAALRYLVGDSGFTLPLREYHYAGRFDMQKQWFAAILDAFPETRFTVCPGANASVADVPTMMQLPHTWAEGSNEPNNDFGSGVEPFAKTLDVQHAVLMARTVDVTIFGPSIVAGTPHPEGWVQGYCGDGLDDLNALMNCGNGHYYPPASPDVPGTGYSVTEYIAGLEVAYGHEIALTEFHPTLYNSRGNKPDQPGWDGHRDAYYTLCTLLRCGKTETRLWWYALYDYGSVYRCGLFPQSYDKDPRPAAAAIRNLCAICADRGDRHSFMPGTLDVTVAGLTDAMDWDLYQASDGRFLIPVWHAAEEPGQGEAVPVTLTFGSRKTRVTIHSPLDDVGAFDDFSTTQVVFNLEPGVVVVEVLP